MADTIRQLAGAPSLLLVLLDLTALRCDATLS